VSCGRAQAGRPAGRRAGGHWALASFSGVDDCRSKYGQPVPSAGHSSFDFHEFVRTVHQLRLLYARRPAHGDSDGSTYVEYNVRQATDNITTSAVLSLLKIAPDGTASSVTQLTSSSSGNDGEIWPGTIIPDGQGGVLATWIVGPSSGSGVQGPNPYRAAHLTPGSTGFFDGGTIAPYILPMAPTTVLTNNAIPIDLSLVLGENGVAFVTYPNGANVVSFNLNSGAVNWNYQPTNSASIVRATAGGGLVINDSVQGIIQLDPSGLASAPVQSLQGTTPFDMGTFISDEGLADWVGVINAQAADAIGPAADVAASDFALPAGNPENQNAASSKAIPLKFLQVSEANLKDGTLFFKYSWSSSSGKRSDLASCKVGETVSYPGSPAEFFFPLPMLGAINPNPTVIKFSAIYLGMKDRNLPPPNGFAKPYLATNFQAIQRFWWSCPYYNNGNLNSFVPDITITRQVFQDTDCGSTK
jgi:hypothetical protein